MDQGYKPSVETIVRTIMLVVAFVNQILTILKINPIPIADDQLYLLLSTAVTLGMAVWAWWKNNSFTKAAIAADAVMKEIKEEDSADK